jgi:nucleotide-binding universal stress UspA family protein
MMTKPRFRIVVAVDLSEYAEIVVEHALDQAARHDAPDLHFITVVKPGASVAQAKEGLATFVRIGLETFHELGADWRARMHVREGLADEEIVNLAAEIRAHLIVVGRFGVHDRGNRLGTIATKVVQNATCPTLVVGLVDQPADRDACNACVAVRAESDGETWFCEAHRGDRLVSSTLTTPWAGGTLMW